MFISSNPRIYSTVAFPPLGNSDYAVFSISNSKGDDTFNCTTYDYSHVGWNGLHGHLREVWWDNLFKLGASAAAATTTAAKFHKQFYVGIDVYTSL